MKIAVGCDHAAYELKEAIKEKLTKEGHEVIDVGCDSTESVDYPKYGHAVGRLVASGDAARGIAVCGSGTSVEMAEMCRRHNNANVVCMGARMISQDLAFDIIDKWMTTEFEGGKHLRRINEIEDLDF